MTFSAAGRSGEEDGVTGEDGFDDGALLCVESVGVTWWEGDDGDWWSGVRLKRGEERWREGSGDTG